MMDYILTALPLMMLGVIFLYRSKAYTSTNPHFFDLDNTKAMRGLWCIIVVMVHVPALYQNTVQDLVGSFAYIGVTFFFMTSSYGLSLQFRRNAQANRSFWKKRLPALLVPQLITNLFFWLASQLLVTPKPTLSSLVVINPWVKWLLCAYLVFWIVSYICPRFELHAVMAGCIIVAISLASFALQSTGIVSATVWSTEIWGVIWGIVLALTFSHFQKASESRWLAKSLCACLAALVLGLLYLKYKFVPFWGSYLLKIVLGAAITLFLLLLNAKISVGNKAIWFLGECSYEVYLAHGSVFYLLYTLFPKLSSGTFILLSLLGTVLSAFLIHQISRWILQTFFQRA